jgi:hypothetical protein
MLPKDIGRDQFLYSSCLGCRRNVTVVKEGSSALPINVVGPGFATHRWVNSLVLSRSRELLKLFIFYAGRVELVEIVCARSQVVRIQSPVVRRDRLERVEDVCGLRLG